MTQLPQLRSFFVEGSLLEYIPIEDHFRNLLIALAIAIRYEVNSKINSNLRNNEMFKLYVRHYRNFFKFIKKIYFICLKRNIDTSPFVLTVHLTTECPKDCDYCISKGFLGHEKFLAPEYFDKITENYIPIIFLSGGEPTIHPNFNELVEKLTLNGSIVYIFTNDLSSTNKIRAIKNKKLVRVILALHPETPCSKKIVNTASELQSEGFTIYLNILVNLNNKNKFPIENSLFIELVKSCDRIIVNKFVQENCTPSFEDVAELRKYAKWLSFTYSKKVLATKLWNPCAFIFSSFVVKLITQKKLTRCSCYPLRMHMNPDGSFTDCFRLRGNGPDENS